MRLVSYNILDGGVGRADPLAEVVIAQRPDVVALVEAQDPAVLQRIAERLGMDVVPGPGDDSTVALLSRWPIRESINHAALRAGVPKGLLEAVIDDPAGAQWRVGVLHLHARALEADEAERQREIQRVLQVFAGHRAKGRPHLLAGDFNSNSPIQHIDPQKCKPTTQDAWRKNGGSIPRRAVQMLLDAGYSDTLAVHAGPAAADMASFTTLHPGQRVDYVFSWGVAPERLRSAWIERDRLAQFASDHFPVGAEVV